MTLLEQLRSIRIGPFAIFDFTTSFAGMWWLAPKIGMDQEKALWLTLPLAVILHELTGQETPLNLMVLGPDTNRVAQAVVVYSLYRGLTYKPQLIEPSSPAALV